MTIKQMADQSGIAYAKIRAMMIDSRTGIYRAKTKDAQYDPHRVKDLLTASLRKKVDRLSRELDGAVDDLDRAIDWEVR